MIKGYDEYIEKIRDRRKSMKAIRDKIMSRVEDTVNTEFSKYLDFITVEDVDNSDDNSDKWYRFSMRKEVIINKIYLIDEDFGISAKIGYYTDPDRIVVTILTDYVNISGKWVKSTYQKFYNLKEHKIEDFIKKEIEENRKKNEKRKIAKEKRRFKRDINKYNI